MNVVNILVQAKDDPKNLLSTEEKANQFADGLTVVFMEGAVKGGQLGIELIIKGEDISGNKTIVSYAVTENNYEALMAAFIGVRMRFGRMPEDQWAMVRHYLKQQVTRFIATLSPEKRKSIELDIKKFFGIN